MPKAINLTGQKFGKLTVLDLIPQEPYANGRPKPRMWLCKCDCGNLKEARIDNLRNSITTHCGCVNELIGKRFGRLIVIEESSNKHLQYKKRLWLCQCDCGNTHISSTDLLNRGEVKSCGCYNRETASNRQKEKYKNKRTNRAQVLRVYKASAQKRGYDFEISDERAFELFNENCFYCGEEPSKVESFRKTDSVFIYNGIDRFDNSKGYVEGNVVSCCTTCNMMKNSMGVEEFIAHIHKVAYRHPASLLPKLEDNLVI